MRGGSLFKWADSLRRIIITSLFVITLFGCNLFSLRTPDNEEGNIIDTPHSFLELLNAFKESILADNINQYEMLLTDSFRFRVCDRIYYSNPDYYASWDKNREVANMQNLFLSLSRSETYPVFFEKYTILELDTTRSDSQFARIEYRIYFVFNTGEIDTASGYMDFMGIKEMETWQVDSIHDFSNDGAPCLSDIKIKFLSK